MNIYDNSLSSS